MSMLFKRIKDWATSITAFRTGDVIPVDGPSGTAKMSKDDLLAVTAENALGSIHSLSDTATEADLVSGNFLAIDGSAGTKKANVSMLESKQELYNDIVQSTSVNVSVGVAMDSEIYSRYLSKMEKVEITITSDASASLSYFAVSAIGSNTILWGRNILANMTIQNTLTLSSGVTGLRIWTTSSNITTAGTLSISVTHKSVKSSIDSLATELSATNQKIENIYSDISESSSFSVTTGTKIDEIVLNQGLPKGSVFSISITSGTANVGSIAVACGEYNVPADVLKLLYGFVPGATRTYTAKLTSDVPYIRIWTLPTNVTGSGTMSVSVQSKSLQTQIEDGVITKYDCPTPFLPSAIYTICNDLGGANYAVKVYLDHLVSGLSRNLELSFDDGSRTIDCYAPYNTRMGAINSSTASTTNNKNTEAVSTTIGSVYTKTRNSVTFNHISCLASNNANKVFRVLCIGDSVTEGTGATNGRPYENNCPTQYWAWLKVFSELLKHQNSDSGFYVETIGDLVRNYFTLNFEGYTESDVRTYSCGKGGSKTSDWLAPTLNDGSTNHFYDPVAQEFSLRYWVENYRTRIVGVDGKMTNCTEGTKGPLAGSIEHTAVCEPTHVLIQLGYNQIYGGTGTTRTNYLNNLRTIIETIANEYPDVKVILSLPDTPCTYSPEDWSGLFSKDELYTMDATYGTAKAAHDNIAYMNADLMDIVGDYSNTIYLPSYFVQPSLWAVQRRSVYAVPFISANASENVGAVQKANNTLFVQNGALPYLHFGCAGHATIGYELLATLFAQ